MTYEEAQVLVQGDSDLQAMREAFDSRLPSERGSNMEKEIYKEKEIWTVEKVIAGEKKDTFWLIEDEDMSAAAINTGAFPKNNGARVFVSMDQVKAFIDAPALDSLEIVEVKTGKAPAKQTGNVKAKKIKHSDDGKYCVTDFGSSKGFCFGRIERYCNDVVKALYLKRDPDAAPKEQIFLAKPLKQRYTLDEIKAIYRHAVLRPEDLAYLESQTAPVKAAIKAGARTPAVFSKGAANWAGKMLKKWQRTVEMIKSAREKAANEPVVEPVVKAVEVKPAAKAPKKAKSNKKEVAATA